jgi:hypothetical protein
LRRLLGIGADLLRTFGTAFLQGDEVAFERAHAMRSERARRYTAELRGRPLITQADAAWRERDYQRVCELLTAFREDLDPVHLRRLDLAQRRREQQASK